MLISTRFVIVFMLIFMSPTALIFTFHENVGIYYCVDGCKEPSRCTLEVLVKYD
jgi:hypothetical protein